MAILNKFTQICTNLHKYTPFTSVSCRRKRFSQLGRHAGAGRGRGNQFEVFIGTVLACERRASDTSDILETTRIRYPSVRHRRRHRRPGLAAVSLCTSTIHQYLLATQKAGGRGPGAGGRGASERARLNTIISRCSPRISEINYTDGQ